MTEWVEQWICIKFCIKLEHSSVDTIWMIQKATTMGNWWLAASSRQCTHASCLMQSFLAKHQITQGTQPHTAQIWCPAASGFFQKWNHLWKGRDFRPQMRFWKIRWGCWWQLVELCQVPRYLPTLKGTETSLSYVQCLIYLVSYSINVSIFHSAWLDTFWTYLVYVLTASLNRMTE